MGLIQLLTTVGSQVDAMEIARAAVDARVAACVQVLGPISSVYRWDGVLREDEEFLCVLKVPSERLERLVQFVRERHPYDTPEITAVQSLFVDHGYLAWVESETRT
jgi:periplasmic divalent cation tolerance protein